MLDKLRRLEIQLNSLEKWKRTGHFKTMWIAEELEERIRRAKEEMVDLKKQAIRKTLKG